MPAAVALISEASLALNETFSVITSRAQQRFEDQDWRGQRADSLERLDLHTSAVRQAEQELRGLLAADVTNRDVWRSMKTEYAAAMDHERSKILSFTFFNSITRRVFDTSGIDPEIEFIAQRVVTGGSTTPVAHLHTYDEGNLADLIKTMLVDCEFAIGFRDVDGDVDRAVELIERRVSHEIRGIEMIRSVHFREQAAYRVGRLITGSESIPFVVALRNTPRDIMIDAVLIGESAVSILFSFTRSHFHIDHEAGYELVPFLQELMPRKRPSELFTALGYHKHGKTLLYREILDHLELTSHRFTTAPGTPGLVMLVFAMPDMDLVFKVLRDRFKPPKRTTRREVKATYELVFKHDRAGRLIDAQEFEHLQLFGRRFEPELLEELLAECGSTTSLDGDLVTLEHVYIERRVTPLNLVVHHPDAAYGPDVPAADRTAAVVDYGQAIRDMAVANVFPGDLLLKNFGLTRHGRVVFYDYDELVRVTECVFRSLPESPPGHEMDETPMWGVGPHDIFPEEFGSFLGLPPGLRDAFIEHHGDLLTQRWWRGIQKRIAEGELIEIPPYSDEFRVDR
ncbi:MAG: bifunctional isocitrate dehydrogenase kinase/phosphatase [Acidimicrobiia bacterium]|nr:bifunctional isocitrate dehydrogenase kinase/phosphatase [Acidimicrobiia bacterium]NNL29305.1 bifunctional isocitrate dehydrogenase kinase/phosphatase [Acidimicrobiia bacterium]